MDDIQANEKRSSSPDRQPDDGTGKVIPLDSEVEQFYGSSTTQAYRLKSELVGKCMEEIGMGKYVFRLNSLQEEILLTTIGSNGNSSS